MVARATLHSADHRSSAPEKISFFIWPLPFKFATTLLQVQLIETREPVLQSVCVTISVVLLAKLQRSTHSPPPKKKKKKRGASCDQPSIMSDFHLIMHCAGIQRQVIVGIPPAPRARGAGL